MEAATEQAAPGWFDRLLGLLAFIIAVTVFGMALRGTEELAYDAVAGLMAGLMLASPYALLAFTGRRSGIAVKLGVLVVLGLSSAIGLAVAGTSSTGGLIFVWLLPV